MCMQEQSPVCRGEYIQVIVSCAYPVKVGVCSVSVALVRLGHVVVDHDVDALDVDTAAHQVGGHQNSLLALLELLVHLRTP